MKRIAAVLLIWVVVFGGLSFYMNRFEARQSAATPAPRQALSDADYSLEVTATFNIEPDPFALRTENSADAAALLVRIGEREILRTLQVEAGVPVQVQPVPGIHPGMNEFFVEANMPLEMAGKNLALQLKLKRDGLPVAEKTLWSEGENRIAGTFPVGLEIDRESTNTHHDK